MIRVSVETMREPPLAFGGGGLHVEPRRGLSLHGPADRDGPRDIRLGFVGSDEDVRATREWLTRFAHFVPAREANSARYVDWPGTASALRARFSVEERFVRTIDANRLTALLPQAKTREGFEDALQLFASRIEGLFGDQAPTCIMVCLPDALADLRIANPALSATEWQALQRLQEEEETEQFALFQPSPEELRAAEELRLQAEDLLFRTFYRALKARVMTHKNAIPIQIIRRDTVDRPDNEGQSNATRAWNLAASVYYKSGGLPWRPGALPDNVCFVGVSFHHLKRRSGSLVYASVAQAFSTDVAPFALKGAMVDYEQRRDRHPYLTEEQSQALMADVLNNYENRAGVLPDRVVVHKTTMYQPEEHQGFRRGALGRVATCELVWLRNTAFRLVRRGMQEPWRGTLCSVGNDTYLFTSGFVPWWKEYPGPHIPAPIELGSQGNSDLRERAKEILALTKMNWNSTEGISRYPITLTFAKRVGQVMSELADGQDPNPSYRFYM